jgi:hypothetical protein
VTGAVSGGTTGAIAEIKGSMDVGKPLFGRGAFDLARRVQTELRELPETSKLLPNFLTSSELKALGLR